ncbi:MAG: divergent polysaccharide deacetylase family protein [Elusimicrobia bacterium]|nr:divergent polysaccharide deacetylase family protein [Elusimicrobiota bacterium]
MKNPVKTILGLGILAVLCFYGWRYQTQGILFDESGVSGQFEMILDDVLDRNGVGESNVLKTQRREIKKDVPLPTLWIETERSIRLSPTIVLNDIIQALERSGIPLKMKVLSRNSRSGSTIVELGKKKNQVFQRIIFLTSGKKTSPSAQGRGGAATIVIDDLAGRLSDIENLEKFFALNIPITYAVLPQEKMSRAISEKIHANGQEIILHQPMEPEDIQHNDPGGATLLVSMSEPEIQSRLKKNLQSVPYALGISNHMGSRFTADEKAMKIFLNSLKAFSKSNPLREDLFFFDSRTSPKSVARKTSLSLRVPYQVNDIFLDDQDDLATIKKQIQQLKKEVRRKGHGIAIGHIQRGHLLQALSETIPEFHKEGIEFVPLSQLIHSPQ